MAAPRSRPMTAEDRYGQHSDYSDADSLHDYDYDYDSLNHSSQQRHQQRGGRKRLAAGHGHGSILMNGAFQKLLFLLSLVVVFDLVYLWDVFDGLDDPADGPEAGLHHLHASRRIENLVHGAISGIKVGVMGRAGQPSDRALAAPRSYDQIPGYAGLADAAKVKELEHEVDQWRGKFEMAMARLGENPYPEQIGGNAVPFTPVPPNLGLGTDDHVRKPKKTREELEAMDTFGADERIVRILHGARVEIDEEMARDLPTWDDVVEMYGEEPIIEGLDTCEGYRASVDAADRMIGPAGMFNTGTNLLYELMKTNCRIAEARLRPRREPRQNGMRWQVPWGKHNPPTTHRFKNIAKAWGKGIKQDEFMPVVLIKDPYTWMGSQCRHKYTTFWGHDEEHCPNLIRWRVKDRDVPSEVRVKYALEMKIYESLLDMWNKWYEEWDDQTFPHLTTRFEDLLFHGEEVTRKACECVGGIFTDDFQYVEDSAKPARGIHKGANGLVKAMMQYGDPKKRLVGYTDRDRWYSSKNMDTALMSKYGYKPPPLPAGGNTVKDSS